MIDLTESIQKRHNAHISVGIFFLIMSLIMLVGRDTVNPTAFIYPFILSLTVLIFTPLKPSFHLREQLMLVDAKGNTETFKIESILSHTYSMKDASGNTVVRSIDYIEAMRLFGKVTNKMGK